jgi:hypothetical protein
MSKVISLPLANVLHHPIAETSWHSGDWERQSCFRPNQGESNMSRSNVFSPLKLSVLTRAVESHCAKHGISNPLFRENIAAQTVQIFQSGITTLAGIEARLENSSYRFG